MTTLLHDLRYGARTLRRSPGFAAVVVLTLSLGIGASTAVFSVVNAVLLEPLPYEEPGRLVRLYQASNEQPDELRYVTGAHFRDYREQLASFEDVAAIYTYRQEGADLVTPAGAERVNVLPASSNYFDVLRTAPEAGRGFRPDEETGATLAVISHDLAQRSFGGAAQAVGRALSLSGMHHTVIGVMPPAFEDPLAGGIDVWTPLDLRPGDGRDHPENHYLTVIGRLRQGSALETARSEIAVLDAALEERYPEAADMQARVVPLQEDVVGGASRTLGVFLAAVGFVLLLVCVNVANLLLVRSSGRRRELAVRSALGSARVRIVRQLLTESLLLAVVGGVLGLGVAWLATTALVTLGVDSIPRIGGVGFDSRVWAFAAGVTMLSAVLAGLAPAIGAARTEPADVLRQNSRSSTAGRASGRARSVLVVVQVALALVLLVGSGLLLSSFHRLQQVELGFQPDGVLTFEVHLPGALYGAEERARFHEDFAGRLRALPGVQAAGAVSRLPATGTYHGWTTESLTGPLAGSEEARVQDTEQRVVAGEFFAAAGIPLLRGRTFGAQDAADAPRRVVVSESFAERVYPGGDALGQKIRVPTIPEAEIVGVVADVALDVEGTIVPHVYHPHRQFASNRNWALTYAVSSSVSLETLIPTVRRELAAMDPALVLHEPVSLATVVGRGTAQRRFSASVLASFAAVALVLAALGLFGVLSYAVRQRTREMGVRLALGAGGRDVQRLVMRQGGVLSLIGIGIGTVAAAMGSRLLRGLLFDVDPLDPAVFAAVAVLLAAVSLLASWIPARRAASVDPIVALRQE